MEKSKAKMSLSTCLQKQNDLASTLQSRLRQYEKPKPPSLKSLSIRVAWTHLEDIIDDLCEIAVIFTSDEKLASAAIARRKKLLNDDVILALAETSWEILDISGSDVSDAGLSQLVKICKGLRAVDISRCSKLTSTGVSELIQHCTSLEILRCGGCGISNYTASSSLSLLKLHLGNGDAESWEELDTTKIGYGAPALRWLVWPDVDDMLKKTLSIECPKIIVNPKPFFLALEGIEVPRGALKDFVLDEFIVQDILIQRGLFLD